MGSRERRARCCGTSVTFGSWHNDRAVSTDGHGKCTLGTQTFGCGAGKRWRGRERESQSWEIRHAAYRMHGMRVRGCEGGREIWREESSGRPHSW